MAGGFITGVSRQIWPTLDWQQPKTDTDPNNPGVYVWTDEGSTVWGTTSATMDFLGWGWFRAYPVDGFDAHVQFDPSVGQQIGFDAGDVSYDHLAAYYGHFTPDRAFAGAMKATGGFQTIYNGGEKQADEFNAWGINPPPNNTVFQFYHSLAFNNNPGSNGWEDGTAILSLIPATSPEPGFMITGAIQNARDEASSQPYVTIQSWGPPPINDPQLVATGKTWSNPYGWGFSEILFFLVPG